MTKTERSLTHFVSRHLVGHASSLSVLSSLASSGRMPHALLFHGPESVGKLRAAILTGVFILSDSRQEFFERNLKLASTASCPDLTLLRREEGKKDISVEKVRALSEELQLKPYDAAAKVAVIDDAHRMSLAASNALLKTLEEPPDSTYLILVSAAAHKLPQTILSRCQEIHFGYLSENQTLKICSQIAERLGLPMGSTEELCKLCDGSLATFRFHSEHPLSTESSEKDAEQILSTLRFLRSLDSQFQKCVSAEPAFIMSLASELASEKERSETVWLALRRFVREQLRTQNAQTLAWAAALEDTLEAERLVRERNANSSLQISSLLESISERQKA